MPVLECGYYPADIGLESAPAHHGDCDTADTRSLHLLARRRIVQFERVLSHRVLPRQQSCRARGGVGASHLSDVSSRCPSLSALRQLCLPLAALLKRYVYTLTLRLCAAAAHVERLYKSAETESSKCTKRLSPVRHVRATRGAKAERKTARERLNRIDRKGTNSPRASE